MASERSEASKNLYLVSFGDTSCKAAKKRLARQARKSGYFKKVWVWGEEDLNVDFVAQNANRLVPGSRGFGYWVWKPQVVLQALQMIPEGSVLLYLDVGCHIVPHRQRGIDLYLKQVVHSDSGVLCSAMEHYEKDWVKGDLFDFFDVRTNRSVTHTGQRQGGVVFYRKSKQSLGFVEEWLHICQNRVDLLDDSPSRSSNFEGFREHRHDQAIFSVLSKIQGASTFDGNELMQWDPERTKISGCFPIETRRDRYPKEPLLKRLMSNLGAPKRFLAKMIFRVNP